MATVTSYTKAAIDTALASKADLVGGKLPDTQAPAISVKHGDLMVNVKDYGATGNGSTPDDAAIIAAIAAAGSGGVVYIPPGVYLLNGSTALTLSNSGTVLRGSSPRASKITIGSGFTAGSAILITGDDCAVEHLAIFGNNATSVTSNPVADGIYVSAGKRARIFNCQFRYINSWIIEAASNTSGAYPDGLILNRIYSQSCAGGIHLLGDNSSASAFNAFVDDIEMTTVGVSTGAAANLDALRVEDAQDVLVVNLMTAMYAGSGSSIHVKGNSVDIFFSNLDSNGFSTGGPNVLIEDGPNGSPRDVHFDVGVIQKGSIGLRATGGLSHLFVRSFRVLDCTTHGISIESTNKPINLKEINFSTNGAGASGTNYDLNWSGSATGVVEDCRFATNVVATGTAGIQNSVNIAAGQLVRFLNANFAGTGASSSNWFTNLPSAVIETSSGALNFITPVQLTGGANTNSAIVGQPSASGNTVLSSNVGGTSAFDQFRITGDGNMAIGPGTAARDTTWGRQGSATIGTPDSDIVIASLGKGLKVKEGTNGRLGSATLSAGTVTVANTSVTANTRVFTGMKTPGGTVGATFCSAITPGTGFTIKSTSSTDTSVVEYLLVEAV